MKFCIFIAVSTLLASANSNKFFNRANGIQEDMLNGAETNVDPNAVAEIQRLDAKRLKAEQIYNVFRHNYESRVHDIYRVKGRLLSLRNEIVLESNAFIKSFGADDTQVHEAIVVPFNAKVEEYNSLLLQRENIKKEMKELVKISVRNIQRGVVFHLGHIV